MRLLAPLFLVITLIATSATAQQATLHFQVDGSVLSGRLGTVVAGAGDVNADGYDDVITATPWGGLAQVHSGLDGSLLHALTKPAGQLGSYYGWSADGVGDIDGDGHADFAVGHTAGTYNFQTTGLVYVYSGADGSILHTLHGDSGDAMGISVSGAGDVDGDGTPDLIVGCTGDDDNGADCGSAKVFSGATGNLLWTFPGDSANDQMGRSVAGAGDVDGDGYADLIAGAFYDDDNGLSCGSARVYSGFDGSIIRTHYGANAYALCGEWVNGGGDVNGDGYADYVVAAPRDDTFGGDLGLVTVHSGIDGSVLYQFAGTTAYGGFGRACACSGDVDGDGHADIVVGEPFDDTGAGGGTVKVFSGADGTVLHTILGDANDDRFGLAADFAGDVDGDGFADLVVGAPYDDDGGSMSGRVTVWLMPTYPYLKYRTNHPIGHRLDCDWIPDGGDPNSLTATIVCSEATPGGLGLYGLSLARIDYLVFGYLPLLVADDPVNLIETGSFGFDILGQLTIPGASRQAPAIAGSLVYLQFFETSPIISCSPGIRLLIAP